MVGKSSGASWQLLLVGSALLLGISPLGFAVRPDELLREVGPGEMTNEPGLYLSVLVSIGSFVGVLLAKVGE